MSDKVHPLKNFCIGDNGLIHENGPNIELCVSTEAMYDWSNSSSISMKLVNEAVISYECQSFFYFFYVANRLMNYWIENTALDSKKFFCAVLKDDIWLSFLFVISN